MAQFSLSKVFDVPEGYLQKLFYSPGFLKLFPPVVYV
jgi:hypothetical protein